MAENTYENTYISLFSGYGGLDLAVRCALPEARCICYVEREAPAAAILAARMEDGGLEDAPIWSDITTFPSRFYRGRVAGLVGGFPCQDLSVAGRRAGIEGERSGLFFEIIRLVRELESVEWLFLENVPPVLNFPAGTTVLGGLAKIGFDAEWGAIRASDVGGSHRRERAFVLAYRTGRGLGELLESSGSGGFVDGGAAANWPTPATRDYRSPNAASHMDRSTGAKHLDQLPNFIEHSFLPAQPTSTPGGKSPSGSTRRLNPDFVDWLMGLIPGWTDYAPLETASYLSKVRSLLRSFLGGHAE